MYKSTYHSLSEDLALLCRPEVGTLTKLIKLYSMFFDAVNSIGTITSELQKYLAQDRIPLPVIKEKEKDLERIINTLGNITLITEIKVDETGIVWEIKEKLGITETKQIEFIEKRIRALVIEISGSCKDKNLSCYLDHLKDKAWRLLETLGEYAEKEYKCHTGHETVTIES